MLTWSSATMAGEPPWQTESSDCTAAIATAERTGDIPAGLLAAIGHVESGRRDPSSGALQPWPWTIDVGGVGHFFTTKAEAVAATAALQAKGIASIDVGCLQVNLAYHPAAFASLDEAFDPTANALYAARFLGALFKATGDWPAAAAAYHSQTRAISAAYQGKVLAIWTPPGSPYSTNSQSPGFALPDWVSAGSQAAPRRPAAAEGNISSLARRAPAAAPPWIERVIAEIAICRASTRVEPAPGDVPLHGAAAWKLAAAPCPSSPFAKPAALRHLLGQP